LVVGPDDPGGARETSGGDGASASLRTRWPQRRTWILLGRTLGGFGAFLAALVAGAQFLLGDDDGKERRDGPAYSFASVVDPQGRLSAELPTAWADLETGWRAHDLEPFADGETVGTGLVAATNDRAWAGDLTTPGAFLGVSEALAASYSTETLASRFSYTDCEIAEREAFRNESLAGHLERWSCEEAASWVTVAASPRGSPGSIVLAQVKLVSGRDEEALERLLATLSVSPP
jgi:hypothetical protein